MYGTVAHWRLKPGKRDELIPLLHRHMAEEERFTSGSIASFLYVLDEDPNHTIMVAIFDSQESYRANSESPGQHQRFMQVRALLAEDPEWNDGEIETYVLAEGARPQNATYGTVAHLQIKPGARQAIEDLTRRQLAADVVIPGQVVSYVLEVDHKPNEAFMMVAFESRETYRANSESPEQHDGYLELRELLAEDPVWYDGEVTAYVRF
jgi:quinol monooxygenase YgiN